MVDSEELMLPVAVARLLKCTVRTVYNMLHDDRLDGVRLGKRSYRVKRSSVERLTGIKMSQCGEASKAS